MTFERFKHMVNSLIARTGDGIKVRFFNDVETGRFIAACSDNNTIIGNSTSLKLTIRSGKNHQYMVDTSTLDVAI